MEEFTSLGISRAEGCIQELNLGHCRSMNSVFLVNILLTSKVKVQYMQSSKLDIMST